MTKQELRDYRAIALRIHQLELDYEYWHAKRVNCVSAPDKAPRYGGYHDAQPYIIDKMDEIKERILERYGALVALRARMDKAIGSLPEPEQSVLHAYYVEGRTWDEVAGLLNYSVQHVYRLHGRALQRISAF